MQEKRGIPSWVAIGFGVVAVALVVALLVRSKQAAERQQKDAESITYHSNNWVQAHTELEEQKQANVNLESQLTETRVEVTNLTAVVAQKETQLLDVQAALKASQEEVAKRDTRIAELESQTQSLEKQAQDLTNSIINLNAQIAETQNRLSASEGDKAALEKELKRLMAEKADLERKFNDLTVLKAQVKKIRTELVTAKRLDWLRSGIQTSEPKGAEKMTGTGAAAKRKHYDLNVELNSDGSTKVVPPITEKPEPTPLTPAPPATPATPPQEAPPAPNNGAPIEMK